MIDSATQIADAMLRKLEGCRLAPYQDARGWWTIGIGSRYLADGSPVTARTPPLANPAAADALLNVTLAGTIARVRAAVHTPLDPNQWAALYSFAFNVGCGAFETSTLCAMLNWGDPLHAAGQFALWNHVAGATDIGLTNRRAYERSVFLGTQAPPAAAAAPIVSPPVTADDLNAQQLARLAAGLEAG